jgi:3-O-methylgallate 3,4-dioxygenase
MAEIVLGIGTSHTPLLSLQPELWLTYAESDFKNPELAFPPHGWVMPLQEGVDYQPDEIKAKFKGDQPFAAQAKQFQKALDTLATTLQSAAPDVTVIISDDQDEWFFEHNMPRFAVFWGASVPMRPRVAVPSSNPEIYKAVIAGYGDIPLEVPIAKDFGRHLVEHLSDNDFDVAHFTHLQQPYGGLVQRRYPTKIGETEYVKTTPEHEQGLPHGFAFIVKRFYNNQPRPILPVFQNTCYPPNQPTPKRSFDFGQAIADAVKAWQNPARVAVVASGGLSHFVVDEEFDRCLLQALEGRDEQALKSLPRERLFSAASESLNWVALGGAMHKTALKMELLDYVPVYRSPAGTGGGWAFARWQPGQ